jgi:hypothetical protein
MTTPGSADYRAKMIEAFKEVPGTTGVAVDPYDVNRATDIRHDAYFPNETSTTHALLALQIALLQDIRYHLLLMHEK